MKGARYSFMTKICKFAFLRSLGHCVVNFLVNSADQCARHAHILRGAIFFIFVWSHEMPAFVDEITRLTEQWTLGIISLTIN